MEEVPNIDLNLIERAKGGSSIALTRLLYEVGARYEHYVETQIPSDFQSLISAEDVIQSARASAMQQLDDFRSDSPGGFMLWFKRIAENSLKSELRRLRAAKRGGGRLRLNSEDIAIYEAQGGQARKAGESLERDEVIVAVRMNLDELPTPQRDAIRLHHIESRSLAETAERLGKTPGKIRGLIERAKKTMKGAMGNTSKWFSSK